ncbi:amidohydrolase [Bacillus sp. HMF5848]|uniref:M20 family metallopeptidase n=1 Tax=Bacillus sp. HMF5848 TaxID=2495421 RepID=UPI000F770A6B|nr:M20 family metallopeptidase [Bacillus sp. HMF5848]RSK26756.1 amidohydrolase [Bacillus sp. HMF5848]
MIENIFKRLEGAYDEMVALRRDFHRNPELSFQEVRTPAKIASYHESIGLEVRTGVGGRGVVATLRGGKPGKTVALRADFDALPIQDEKDVPYKSQVPGAMHACGHDGHTATLLVLAKALVQVKEEIAGNIVFIHQFAEELAPGGAKPMIEDGCLDGVDAIYGTHLWSVLPVGQIGYRAGYAMAAADAFEVVIQGKGGHGAQPHETVDPIVIGAQVINNLQTVVSRRTDPLKSAVLTIGQFHAGNAFNVIPDKAKLSGTVRTFDESVRLQMEQDMARIINCTCAAYGATATFSYDRGYPAVWNHKTETDQLVETAKQIVGEDNVIELDPVMGGEDFAYYLREVPGTFFFTGAGNQETGITYPHHHPKFDIDEKSMLLAAKHLAGCALSFLHGDHKVIPLLPKQKTS